MQDKEQFPQWLKGMDAFYRTMFLEVTALPISWWGTEAIEIAKTTLFSTMAGGRKEGEAMFRQWCQKVMQWHDLAGDHKITEEEMFPIFDKAMEAAEKAS